MQTLSSSHQEGAVNVSQINNIVLTQASFIAYVQAQRSLACPELISSNPRKESKEFITVKSGTSKPNSDITEEETEAPWKAQFLVSEPEHKPGSLLRALSSFACCPRSPQTGSPAVINRLEIT